MTTATLPVVSSSSSSKGLRIALSIAQALLGVMFFMVGLMKTFQPLEAIGASLPWVLEYPAALTRFIGISELAAGVGLVLPGLLRIKPFLVPLAAAGLVVVMILAAGFHALRGEFGAIPMNLVLGGLAAFIAWGRHKKAPIASR
ncbi:MAG TPA: DoxX family protein [Myxococcaceae bacterium]|nr:DoxX family protein [Myxococcaceae bacterium]